MTIFDDELDYRGGSIFSPGLNLRGLGVDVTQTWTKSSYISRFNHDARRNRCRNRV